MGIANIKCTRLEIEEKIKSCCNFLEISCEKFYDKGNLMQFLLKKGEKSGKLRVYESKKGIKLDDTIFECKDLYNSFETVIKQFLEKTETRKFSFKKITNEQFEKIYSNLEKLCCNDINIYERDNKDPNKDRFFEIKNDKTKELVRVSKFKNGTLLLDGIDWLIWGDICSIIDKEINSTPLDIFDRFLETKEVNIEDIDKVYRTSNYTKEEETLNEKLTCIVFTFLDEHFRNYLISSQRLIDCGIKLPEYSPILCPVAKVLEGYLKRLLVELGLETYESIEGKWNFGHVFNGEIRINNNKKCKITVNQEQELLRIYKEVNDFRNSQNHGSLNPTKVYNDRGMCLKKYNQILDLIKSTYYNIGIE